jgi:calmodulin
VDAETLTLKEESVRNAAAAVAIASQEEETSEAGAEAASTTGELSTAATQVQADGTSKVVAPTVVVANADRNLWRQEIPYFAELSLADYDALLDQAKELKFDAGGIIMREGRHGRTFYILQSGEVEICQRAMMGDPLTTPPNYLGTVINRLQAGDFFGERGLITGEPRAASIRAVENSTCWAFDKDDFPPSSVLSGRTRLVTNDLKELVDDKYGVAIADLYPRGVEQQIRDSSMSNQVRGSINTPEFIRGVDTEDEIQNEDAVTAAVPARMEVKDDAIFSLLNRFKMIRLVSRCFRYIVQTRAQWGDEGIRTRRGLLVSRLTVSQRTEYEDTFKLIDSSGDGTISLLELKRVMESIGDTKSDDELKEMLSKGHDAMDDESVLTLQDFMGIMAETEFYHLFRDIFASLDTNDTGFVKNADLQRVLNGVRDLISDDRKSIIDVEDDDMLIDYEQFSRMLLGTALI